MPLDVPWQKLTAEQKNWVIHGDKEYNGKNWRTHWYGIKAYFDMLESKSYKMHVRVHLANYRGYALCPDCRAHASSVKVCCGVWGHARRPTPLCCQRKDSTSASARAA